MEAAPPACRRVNQGTSAAPMTLPASLLSPHFVNASPPPGDFVVEADPPRSQLRARARADDPGSRSATASPFRSLGSCSERLTRT